MLDEVTRCPVYDVNPCAFRNALRCVPAVRFSFILRSEAGAAFLMRVTRTRILRLIDSIGSVVERGSEKHSKRLQGTDL